MRASIIGLVRNVFIAAAHDWTFVVISIIEKVIKTFIVKK
jgi:hypothetical protein